MSFEEEEIAVMHRANVMDQGPKLWQRFMIRKPGSQTDLKMLALHGCFALHNEFVSETAVLSITWDTFAHDSSHFFFEITLHIAYQLHRSYVCLHTRMEIMDGAVMASARESEQGMRVPRL